MCALSLTLSLSQTLLLKMMGFQCHSPIVNSTNSKADGIKNNEVHWSTSTEASWKSFIQVHYLEFQYKKNIKFRPTRPFDKKKFHEVNLWKIVCVTCKPGKFFTFYNNIPEESGVTVTK